MSERKSINKFQGNEFIEAQTKKLKHLQKSSRSKSANNVRLMAPFSIKCTSCNEYIAKSRKFNAKKETLPDTYLGMRIYRFTIRCPMCSSQISYRTDPKTADYVLEKGAVRNYVSSANAEAEKLRNESIETTLDRLEKEEMEEMRRKEGKGNADDDDLDVVQKLEKKFEANQRELEANREIQKLLNQSSKLEQNLNSGQNGLKIRNDLDDDLGQIAKDAFKNAGSHGGSDTKMGSFISKKNFKITKSKKKKIVI